MKPRTRHTRRIIRYRRRGFAVLGTYKDPYGYGYQLRNQKFGNYHSHPYQPE